MEPIKIRILKRSYMVEDVDSKIPYKKRFKEVIEKENNCKKTNSPKSSSKRGSKILKTSPIPDSELNSKISDGEVTRLTSSDDEVDSVFDEMLFQLNKSGSKIMNSKNSAEKPEKKLSKKKSSDDSFSLDYSVNKSKRHLLKEFEILNGNVKKDKKVTNTERKVADLEKLSENLILNYKRTPKKIIDLKIFETPKKEIRVETPRRSLRSRTSISKETVSSDLEKTPVQKKNEENTPVRRPNRTPKKKLSSTKKVELVDPKTPTTITNKELPRTPLEKVRENLHVSTVPESLPCREKEFCNILKFVENKLWDGIGGCMYISGVPGTGKTATVSQVMKHLLKSSKEGNVPEFKYIEINAMRLSSPRQAYVHLWQSLFDKKDKIAPDRAQRLLDEWFSKSDRQNTRKTTVLLVDELDLICTKKQDVVYNLLDWPTRTHSRLVVLTIANTMDMPERLFKGRVTSRMGLTRLTFMPYTHKQLEEIVLARLKGFDAFVTDAVRLATRKVAAVSGDARRALDICRRATELPPPDECVKISHIEQAIKEMTNSNIVKVLRNCGEIEKLFLRSLSDVSSRANVEEVDLREVIDQLYAICVLEGISRPSISSILSISNRLKCCRLIFSSQSSAGVLQKVTLNVTQNDIHYALRS